MAIPEVYGARFATAFMLMAAFLFGPTPAAMAQDTPLIFAAASLKDALDDVSAAWKEETGKSATISYASSSALAKQIEEGAPANLFISADLAWMDYLAERNLIKADTRVELLGNRIVLVAPAGSDAEATIEPGFDLAGLLGDRRLAMANVEAVPAGRYGKAALETLGVWDQVSDKLAQAENVRAALALVSLGEAPLGIVYQTDAAADDAVKVVGTFPQDTHEPIIYPAALMAASENPDAQAFLDYLQTAGAKELFERQGFTMLVPVASQ